MARSADASDTSAYQQAIHNLAAPISECVGAGLLLKTTEAVGTASQLLARMKHIASMRQALRQAISTAGRTRESGPLADCLDKRIITDNHLRDPCADLIECAETLLADIRDKSVREGMHVQTQAQKHSPDMYILAFTSTGIGARVD